ncbi:TonB-dependent receptor [Novosphingobium sp. M1R2S20]|uniref:TonB-dependent receptor n=1 Tax=Novosphingobium rhizovicinum TaxID=3228928 RepID=A0ABV3RET8_9SPHN
MRRKLFNRSVLVGTSLAALMCWTPARADEAADAAAEAVAGAAGSEAGAEMIIVTGQRTTFNNSAVSEILIDDQPPLQNAIDLIDTLPGVSVNQGDAYGFDDWSTTLSVRGFQTNLDQQQVGITIDGMPNGDSGYGGGAKANRYVDTMNLATVEVSQGTADIATRSNEALGGTINFVTSDPLEERRVRLSGSFGDAKAQRYYGRFDTGSLLDGQVRAWISASHQEASDWIGGSAENRRTNVAGKFIIETPVRFTGYASYDDAHEDNYDQIYSAEQFATAPDRDGLTSYWTGVPVLDQQYRRVWSTLRENFFTYLKAETTIGEAFDIKASGYYHDMSGRGDWAPPYIVDVIQDGTGAQSELGSGRVDGTPSWWATLPAGSTVPPRYTFVNAQGVALTPTLCADATDPRCYVAGAIGAQSYRHTHYSKKRIGGTLDGAWTAQVGAVENVLRGGLWYEDTRRKEWRDWHNVVDTTVGPDFADAPYWVQYNRRYPQDTFKWYVQDAVTFGPVTVNFGAKQFINHIDREDIFGETPNAKVKSKSDVLFSGGVQFQAMENLNLFGGYAENFKALTDALLEFGDEAFVDIEPETAKNWEAGVRYTTPVFQASATWFKSKFANRVIFVPNTSGAGIDYLGEGDGTFFNAGGIDSEGFELLANVRPLEGLTLYGSYTYIDATYRGTGNAVLDEEQGITAGNRVTGIPEHMWVLSGSYSTGPLTFGVTGKYTGDRAVNVDNTWIADNYFLTDVNLSLRGEALSELLKAVTLSLTVNNVTDESYLGGISGNYAWIGTPRTAVFTVTADF